MLDTQEAATTPAETWIRLSTIFQEEMEILRKRYNMIRGQHEVVVDKYIHYQQKFAAAIAQRATTPMLVDEDGESDLTRIVSCP